MADIFLSYAEEDRDAALRIVGVLEGHGWTVWWDRRIPTGKTWRSVIEDGIRDMRCMVVLWSRHSVGSEWVNEKAEEGRAAGKLLRPQQAPGDGSNTPKPATVAPILTAPAAVPVAAPSLPLALLGAPAVASSAAQQPSAATVPPGSPKPAAVEKSALKPPVTQKAASQPAPHQPPVAKRAGKSKVDHSRCEAILQRAQLGATLTEEDKAFLNRGC